MVFAKSIRPDAVRAGIKKAIVDTEGGNASIVVVLHDNCLSDDAVAAVGEDFSKQVTFLNCEKDELIDWSKTPVFVYACGWSTNGTRYMKEIMRLGGKYYAIHEADPTNYADRNATARLSLEAEHAHQVKGGYAKWDFGPGDFLNICQFIETTRGVKGSYVEIGCFRGSSGGAALRYMREAGIARDCWFFDVFEGFNYEAAKQSSDATWVGTHQTEGVDAISSRLTSYATPGSGLSVRVRLNNIITDPLPAEIESISVANIDVDIYEAVLAGLNRVRPRLAKGGIMIVEDDGHTPLLIGARIAVEEFSASPAAVGLVKIVMESGQTIFVNLG